MIKKNLDFIKIFFLLFFFLLIFCKFSISGDIESRLSCIKSWVESDKLGSCEEQRYYLYIFHILFAGIVNLIDSFFLIFELENISIQIKKIFYEIIISIFFYTIFIINLVLLIKISYLKTKKFILSLFLAISFTFTSYLGNFISFEHFETIIAFLFILKIFLINHKISNKKIIINFIIDLIISTYKIYYAPSILLLNYIIFNNNFKLYSIYNSIYFILCITYFYITTKLIESLNSYNFISWFKPDFNLSSIVENFFLIFFSPSVGLFITAPLIMLVTFLSLKNYETKIKFLSLLSLISILSLFYFWEGGGSSGSRYIYPLLYIFYIEYNNFIIKNIKRIFLNLFLLLAFIGMYQSINYQSPVLFYGYTDKKIYKDYKITSQHTNIVPEEYRFPKYNIYYSPYIFPWKIEFYRLLNKENINFNVSGKIKSIDTWKIIPNSLIARLNYSFNQSDNKENIRLESKQNILNYLKINNFFYIVINFIYISLFIYLMMISRKIKIG